MPINDTKEQMRGSVKQYGISWGQGIRDLNITNTGSTAIEGFGIRGAAAGRLLFVCSASYF